MHIEKDQLSAYLLGSLKCSGVVCHRAEVISALSVYRQLLAGGCYHLPFFLVVDLLMVLEKGYDVQFRSDFDYENAGDRKLLMRYERECLGRILQSPEIGVAIEIAGTSQVSRQVTERLLAQVVRSIESFYPKVYLLNPGLLRDYQFPDQWQVNDDFSNEIEGHLERFIGALGAGINWSGLLYDEDIFELSHLEVLNSDHLRVGCRQILEVSRLLGKSDPVSLDIASHEDGADTAYLDETHYPTGGLAGLTNRGSFENLLTSELVYLDEGTKDVSLFELRYAEGELLYYMRDSGNLRRKRRSVHFIIDVGIVFENKASGYDWQYSVLLQGICLRLLHDLFQIFETDALRFHFHYIIAGDIETGEREFFEGEIGVMKTVLSDYVKHDWVTFQSLGDIGLEELVDLKRKTYAVVFSGPESRECWESRFVAAASEELNLHRILVGVDCDSPEGQWPVLPAEGLSIDQLNQLRGQILEGLIS